MQTVLPMIDYRARFISCELTLWHLLLTQNHRYEQRFGKHNCRHNAVKQFLSMVEDCSGVTDVAAYASVIASSVQQPTDAEMLTSHGITFRDLETGAFCLQTQLLQVSSLDSLDIRA